MAQADHPLTIELLDLRVPFVADHPALLLTNQMMQASKMRDAIHEMLAKRKVRRLDDYQLMVDFTLMPDRTAPVYGYNLRVFKRGTPGERRKPVVSIWAETRDQLVTDENMLLLLMLYNS